MPELNIGGRKLTLPYTTKGKGVARDILKAGAKAAAIGGGIGRAAGKLMNGRRMIPTSDGMMAMKKMITPEEMKKAKMRGAMSENDLKSMKKDMATSSPGKFGQYIKERNKMIREM